MSLLPNLYLLLPPKHKHPKELNSFLQCFLILFWINLPKGDQWPTMYCYHYLVLHSVVASANQSHNSPWTKSESEVAQLCPTLCDPMDCSLPGSSVHRIFQARVLEWVAISFSRGSSRPRDQTQVSHVAGRRFTIWATRKAPNQMWCHNPSTLCSRKPLLPRCTRVDETYLVSCLTPFILLNQDKSKIT